MKTIRMTIDARHPHSSERQSKQNFTANESVKLEAQHRSGYRQQPVSSGEFDMWLAEQDWGAT